ncbi:hypothetical protein MCOR30_001411 [Pyricularia oryzae]|nr:hypothetical protein MCOR30_001411 [Pyricularia oryzae]
MALIWVCHNLHVSKFAQLTALLAVAAPVLASNQATDSPRGIANFPNSAGASPAGAYAGSPRRAEKAAARCEARRRIQARTEPTSLEPSSPSSPLDWTDDDESNPCRYFSRSRPSKIHARHSDPIDVKTPLEPETVTLPGHIRPVKVKSFKKKILPEGNPSPKAPQDSAALDKRTTLNWAHGVELIDGYRKNTLGCPASSLTKNPTLVLTGKPKEGEEAKKPEESTKPKEPQEKPKE